MRIAVPFGCLVAFAIPAGASPLDAQLEVALVACQRGAPAKCLDAAAQMDDARLEKAHGFTAVSLRQKASSLLENSCAEGDAPACYKHGRYLIKNHQVEDGVDEVELACTLGDGVACLYIGEHHVSGRYLPRDEERAIAMFEKACTAGNARGCEQLAHFGPESGRTVALHRKACDGNDPGACFHSGEDRRAQGDNTGAFSDFLHACDLKEPAACVSAGQLAPNAKRSRELYVRACDAGVGEGCTHIAEMWSKGRGGDRNWGQALQFAQQGCQLDHQPACALLEQLKAHPPDGKCSNDADCQKLCKEGVPSSCRQLAELHGGSDEAYEMGCNAGDGSSCRARGHASASYADGESWYVRGCKSGDATSCTYTQYGQAKAGSQLAEEALHLACTSDQEACVLLGLLEYETKPAEADHTWRIACSKKNGTACRMVSQHQRPSSLGARAFMKSACKLGDSVACSATGHPTPRKDTIPAWE